MRNDLAELAVKFKVKSHKYHITPKHMAMAMLALAEIMEEYGSSNTEASELIEKDVQEAGFSNLSQLYRVLAKEIMK